MKRISLTSFSLATAFIAAVFFYSCKSNKKAAAKGNVTIHISSDPEMLNPLCYTDAHAAYIMRFMFQSLLDIDYKTLEPVPVLAESKPTMEKTQDGKLKFTYKIRPEAKWDNGTPITAKDIEFTLKAIKNPKVNNPQVKPGYEHLTDFIYDEKDPLKFTIVFDATFFLAEMESGDYTVIPEYFYDPKGLMKGFTIKQLNEDKELANDPKINEFATDFNSEKRMREKSSIQGSGPYQLDEWTTGQRVVLKRKENWWGDKFKGTNMFFDANPAKLTYKVINDQTSALVALKAGDLDLMATIKAKDFSELVKSDKFKEKFNLYTPMALVYTFIGLNNKRPFFSDRRTREAIAHLVDINKMIQTIHYGYAQATIGPIHPSKAKMYNNDIKPYDYNIEKAKQLLTESGWKDSNGDGTIDKTIDGKHTEFIVDYTYNAGNDSRKQTGLLLQEEARKVGIQINIVAQEWSVYLENCKKHNFDINFGGWVAPPVLPDLKQLYHSESALNGGSNFSSFGTPESDALLDSIRVELNEDKRNAMYKKLQQIIHDDATYIFLTIQNERMAISKRFSNAEPSVVRPGYYEAGFTVNDEVAK